MKRLEDKKDWIWLIHIPGVGGKRAMNLLERFKTPCQIRKARKQELVQVKGIGGELAEKITFFQEIEFDRRIQKEIQYMKKQQIHFITIEEKEYPDKLRQIYDPPIGIYVKGNTEILSKYGIGIVGCRNCSPYGERIAKKFSYELAQKGITIISGLARGIDSYAHIGCLMAEGRTIAVVGCGLDKVYPKENLKLEQIILKKGGVIISEYPIGTPPLKMNFPARNRIISGLANGILVVEAKEKSGTLITVDFALEQGKDVFIVPGNIDSENSTGTNRLIKEGAKMVTNIEDILE